MRHDDEMWGLLFIILMVFGICITTLTRDNSSINLQVITEMSAKCDSNGGLDRIEHDYDVLCKNGAEFNYGIIKESK